MKILCLSLLLLFVYGCSSVMHLNSKIISDNEARNIVQHKIEEYGWKVNDDIVEVFWSITPWDKYFPDDKEYYNTLPYHAKFNKKLQNRKYWSVYYSPKNRAVKGGEFCFFVDAETGEIIDIYIGV